MNDKRFATTPMVLETPKDKEMKEDRMNLKTLRSLVKGKRPKEHGRKK
jgi:deoxyribonuclease-4